MKNIIYISGVTGGVILGLRVIGIFADFSLNNQFLVFGLVLSITCITLISIYKQQQNQKIKNILSSHKERSSSEPTQWETRKTRSDEGSGDSKPENENGENDNGGKKTKPGPKGLEPGKTSLRERKAGLVWGGGNIKGAEATRGTRRRFIKRW